MAAPAQWSRVRGVLCTYVLPYGVYSIRKHHRGVRRVYLNQDGTTLYGTEKQCMEAVQRVINSMENGREQGIEPLQVVFVQGQGPGDRRDEDTRKRQPQIVSGHTRGIWC